MIEGGGEEASRSRFDVLTQGSRLGAYEILGRVAVGGMAEIYLAGLEGFRKLVIIKRILPDFADNEEYVRMLVDEAQILARLHHDNVVGVYNIDSVDGHHFYAMEYVHGESAHRLMGCAHHQRRDIPYEHALTIVMGAAAGLHHAHEARDGGGPLGIVHRDVSPSNILITFDGKVKVVDFGVAKARVRQSITRGGTLKGKVAYMSPEQCLGDAVDRRSDVFALGVLLYELTTGVRPFRAHSDLGVVKQILETAPPPPLLVRPGYPQELERIVTRALARSIEDRYQSADELRLDLEAFAVAEGLATSAAGLASFMEETFGKDARASVAEASGYYDLLSLRGPTRSTALTASATPPMLTARQRLSRPLVLILASLFLLALAGAGLARVVRESSPPPASATIIPRPIPAPIPPPPPPPPSPTPPVLAPAPPQVAPAPRPRRRRPIPPPAELVKSPEPSFD